MIVQGARATVAGEKQLSLNLAQRIGLVLGPTLCLLIYLFFRPAGLGPEGVAALAGTAWIAAWWVTEAIPIPITSLLPVILFPVLGLGSVGEVVSAYADPTLFLFLGGFIIAVAIERWNLHRRIALAVISAVGTSPSRLVLGFMLATGVLSAFISNSATAMMMLPIGIAVVKQITELRVRNGEKVYPDQEPFSALILLAIAYAASIGGVGSIIGSPPNAIMVGVAASTLGVEISFFDYMLVGVPMFLVFTLVAWRILLWVMPPGFAEVAGSREWVRRQMAELGPMSGEERKVLGVFCATALLWITYPFLLKGVVPGISDAMVAIFGASLLFLIPGGEGGFLLDESALKELPWGVLLLFGAGFCIAEVFQSTGVAVWLAGFLQVLAGAPYFLIVIAVAAMVTFLTEITSNTAIAAIFMPIMASLATALGAAPTGLMVVAALAGSLAFMLPVGTPPNAIVFSSGRVTIRQMIRVGFFLNLAAIATITLIGCFWVPLVWGR
ncbi:SLC13 family permease [Symbiobacterium thermophilum]|uniref:SLC13 family permease n=1 Tax=Symbiobacterium thermophilum TaxID=2734 RepID=UPI00030EECAF|nr:DASS family sodium-coupled anion symporter [Symbiobacterium thermophilum]